MLNMCIHNVDVSVLTRSGGGYCEDGGLLMSWQDDYLVNGDGSLLMSWQDGHLVHEDGSLLMGWQDGYLVRTEACRVRAASRRASCVYRTSHARFHGLLSFVCLLVDLMRLQRCTR